ncbi:hypothetical protein [Streptococcus canis]|uniref:hypothetical protein n=1 Tax=Streptococcus canis TaxID=1329 RepID=UPI002F963DF6
MTRFEIDYLDAKEGNGIEVLKRRKQELKDLKQKLSVCKNGFRAQCLMQEIEIKEKEYQKMIKSV